MKNEVFRPEAFTEREAYLWSIEEASFKQRKRWFKGHLVELQRAELITSYNDLAETFRWSVKRVRGFVTRMMQAGLWAKRGAYEGAKAPTVLRVCKYDEIQFHTTLMGAEDGIAEGAWAAKRGPTEGTEQKKWKNTGETREDDGEEGIPAVSQSQTLAAVEFWNEHARACGWPVVREPISTKRQQALRTLLQRVGVEKWKEAVLRAAISEFLATDRPTWFTFDAVLDPDKFDRLLEGNYDRLKPGKINAWTGR